MHRYEILLLAVPEITEDEARTLEKSLDHLIKEAGGTTISFERWGKYKLAYPIRKNDYGVYFLIRFEVDDADELLENIQSLMKIKLAHLVMRHMVSVLSPKQSLAYQRPLSLEETPSRDVDSFLKENKMEGLLSSVKGNKEQSKEPIKEEVPVNDEVKTSESSPEAVESKE